MRSLPPGGAVRRRADGSRPELAALAPDGRAPHGRQPARQRRPAAARPARCPTSATTRSTVAAPGDDEQRGHARARRLRCATSCAPTPTSQLPRLRARRDRLQPAGRASSRRPTAPGWPSAATATTTSPRTAASWRSCREHLCQGWLEGYLLTGRHGLFNCYEAFIHIVDSMFNQHAKWLKVTRGIPWRRPIASLNYLLSSHVWRQDHNGFSHQDPGFIDHVVNKKAEIIRVYLPPDANTPAVGRRPLPAQPRLRQRHRGRQAARAGLAADGRGDPALHARHRHLGLGRAATTAASRTSSSAAPATSRRSRRWPPPRCCASTCPSCKVRVVNVVDLMRLQPRRRASRTGSPTTSSTRCSRPTGR